MASNRELSQFASKVVVNDTTGTISFGTTVTDLVVSGVSTFSNVVIGGASTSLVVTGDAHISGAVTAASFHGDGASLTGLNASNITSGLIPSSVLPATMVNDISGNAGTASAWETARTFAIVGDGSGSVSLDGSSNVSLNLTVTGGDADTLNSLNSTQFLRSDQSDTMSGTLTANFFAGNGSALTGLNASNITTGTLSNERLPATLTKDISGNAATATNATFAGSADTLDGINSTQFLRSDQSDSMNGTLTASAFAGDGSGLTNLNASNISSGTISADRLPSTMSSNITGNADTASAWETARTFSIAGDANGSVSLDGSSDVTLSLDVTSSSSADNSLRLNGLLSSQFLRSDQSDSMNGTLTASAFAGDGSALTNLNASNISSGTIPASRLPSTMSGTFNGNADTSSRWANARTINLSGDASGSVSIDGSSDVTLTVSVSDAATAANALALGNLNATQFVRSDQSDSISGTLTATAFGGSGASLTNLNASNIATGTISNDRLPATITKNISGNAATATNATSLNGLSSTQFLRKDQSGSIAGSLTATSFAGTGAFLTQLSATNISQGTLDAARLPTSITSNTSGNAATATRWASSRTITLAGDTTGSVSLNGSADVTLTVAVNDDSHNHTIANVDGLQTALDGKASATNNFVESTTVTEIITLSQASYDSLVSSGSVVSTVLYVVV
jgi:hypothetical protein